MAGSQLPRPTAAGDSPCIRGIPRGAVRRALQPLYAGREGIKWPHGANWALPLAHRLRCLSHTGLSPARPTRRARCSRAPCALHTNPAHGCAPTSLLPRLWKGGRGLPARRIYVPGFTPDGTIGAFLPSLQTWKKPRCLDAVPGLWLRVLLEQFHFLCLVLLRS